MAGIISRIVKDASTSAPVAMPRYNRFADYFKAHTPPIKLFHIINAPHQPEQAGGPLPLQHEYDPRNSKFSVGRVVAIRVHYSPLRNSAYPYPQSPGNSTGPNGTPSAYSFRYAAHSSYASTTFPLSTRGTPQVRIRIFLVSIVT